MVALGNCYPLIVLLINQHLLIIFNGFKVQVLSKHIELPINSTSSLSSLLLFCYKQISIYHSKSLTKHLSLLNQTKLHIHSSQFDSRFYLAKSGPSFKQSQNKHKNGFSCIFGKFFIGNLLFIWTNVIHGKLFQDKKRVVNSKHTFQLTALGKNQVRGCIPIIVLSLKGFHQVTSRLMTNEAAIQYMKTLVKKRDLKKLYKPPGQQDYSQNYKRLVIVILISFVFIAAEIVAGTIAHSIAIISDAIHLISDTIGFFFSFLFLYLSRWPPNAKMTFGHHRMQLLGAISNIFIIWILIFFVVYESTNRIINRQFVESPMIMLITAGGGLLINIVMYKVLHGGANHSHGLLSDGCGHDHGEHGHDHGEHGHEHDHGHGHQHEKTSNKQSKGVKQNSASGVNQLNLTETNCLQEICQDDDCNVSIQAIHCHKDANIHKHASLRASPHKLPPIKPNQNENKPQTQTLISHPRQIKIRNKVDDFIVDKYCEQDHQHSNLCYLSPETNKKHQHICNHQHQDGESCENKQQTGQKEQESFQHIHSKKVQANQHQHDGKCSHDHGPKQDAHQKHEHKHEGCGGHGHDHGHHGHNHGKGHQHDQENGRSSSIGMQAAVLHALSDMIMSAGLIVSSLIIFFLGNPGKGYADKCEEWNAWHLFDPISTYLFSIIALGSTVPVVKNAYLLLMESTPQYINLVELRNKCEQIEGVVDVHDIHVWDLKPGKTCMIAHVLAKTGTERKVLVELSDIARENKIFHTTFQVQEQEWKHEDSYILCDHDIH